MVRIKVCGITNLEDALHATECGADALGFIFAPSPRQVTVEQTTEIVSQLPPFVTKVGVFFNHYFEEVRNTMSLCSLNVAQLHGDESPEYCRQLSPVVVKSFRVKEEASLDSLPMYNVSAFLLDSYVKGKPGGTGTSFDWTLAFEAKAYGLIIISGGLNPGNVRNAIDMVQPYGVDVCSGVEISPGKKDPDKVRQFIEEVKNRGE